MKSPQKLTGHDWIWPTYPVRRTSGPEPLEARIAPAFVHPFPLGSLDGANGVTINGVAANDFVGNIAEAGDVNGDGFGDLIVAASGTSGGTNNAGEAYVIFGQATGFDPSIELSALDGNNGFKLTAVAPAKDHFFAVSGAGDVNGDGFADVVIGSQTADGTEAVSGAAWVVFGHSAPFTASLSLAAPNGTNGFKINGVKAQDAFGGSVAAAGDVNGDGLGDVIIGAQSVDRGALTNAGAAYVILGRSAAFPPVLSAVQSLGTFGIFGAAKDDRFGISVSGAGDVNGDGFDDVIAGALQADSPGATDGGASYVVFGRQFPSFSLLVKDLDGGNGFRIRGVTKEFSGTYVSEGGDINGDGFADLLVASLGSPGVPTRTSVVFGHAAPFTADFALSALDGGNGFRVLGESQTDGAREIHSAGDVNGDGFDDFIVGAQAAAAGAGAAYLVFGGGAFGTTFLLASVDGTNGFKLTGIAASDFAGATPRGGGDVNGDGFDDLVLGARGADPGGRSQAGQAYVIFGSDTGAVTHPGDGNANTLTGDISANVIIGGRASDTLLGKGGEDILRGGEGDDVLAVSDLAFKRAEGGLGSDTLQLDGAGFALSLASLSPFQLRSIEAIDLTGLGDNALTLTAFSVLGLSGESNTLTVFGNAGDTVNMGAGWVRADAEMVGGVPFNVFYNGEAKLRVAPGVASTPKPVGFLLGQAGDFKLRGVNAQDRAGTSIANAGDVNGDGFDDVIIGAGSADGGFGYSGAAYVVFGKPGGFAGGFDLAVLDGMNGFRVTGGAQGFGVGRSVGAAGDFNGDGFGDVIVGAPSSSAGGTYSGAAYIIFGKATPFTATIDAATLDGTNGFRFTGEAANQFVGDQVGLAGDLNGDGLDDVFVGSSGADLPTGAATKIDDTGAVHVIFGTREKLPNFGPSSQFYRGFTIYGAVKGDRLSAGGAAGDINGDGFDDLIIGGKYADANGFDSGAAYVIYGKADRSFPFRVADLDGKNGFQMRGEKSSDRLGGSVSGAGDVNGDGFADLLIGTETFNSFYGASYVVFGKSGSFGATFDLSKLNGANGFEVNGGSLQFGAGRRVAGGGDVNGDGFDDVVLGAYSATLRGSYSGGAFVVYGKANGFTPTFSLGSLDGQSGFVLSGEAAFNSAGFAVGGGGDVNGDGFDDVLVGAPFHSANGANSGAGYVFFGFDSGAVTHPGDANANTLTGDAGANVLVAGDGNDTLLGNGGLDSSRGARGDDIFGLVAPLPPVPPLFPRIIGGTGLDTLRFDSAGLALNLTTIANTRLQGIEVIDLNSAVANNTLTLTPLEVLNLSPTSNTLTILGGADDHVNLGPNWFRGVPENIGGTDFTVLHHGEATLKIAAGVGTSAIAGWSLPRQNGERAFTINGTSGFGNFGEYAASAGDVNGDGFEDVIIGDYSAVVGGVNRGAAYVVFGKGGASAATLEASTLDGMNGFRITDLTAAAGDSFGQRVSGVGDVNGDGFADVMVSDSSDDVAGANTGAAWVIFGRSGPFAADFDVSAISGFNGFKLTGEAVNSRVGNQVSGAGDVNGDGFADVMLSSLNAAPNGKYSGSVYVVFGKASGFDATMPLTSLDGFNGFRLEGEAANNFTGLSLAAAGDVNGDGFGDVLMSARADLHGVDSGAVYLVFGKAGGFAAKVKLSTLDGTTGVRFEGAKANDFAEHVGVAGDINGDGLDDIVIGAVGVDGPGGTYDGAAYVIFGKPTPFKPKVLLSGLTEVDGFRITSEATNSFAGVSVNTAGDVNGDGFDDVLIVASGATFDGRYSGGAYVLLGRADGFGSSVSLAQIDGQNLGFRLSGGRSSGEMVAVGDVNGDGFDDVIYGERTGSLSESSFGAGVVHVFFGLDTGAVTHAGDANANTLTGDASANVFVAGQANDMIVGNGGADAARGGQGDDIFEVKDLDLINGPDFRRLHGGTGLDTLRLDGAGLALNLTELADSKLEGFERIDITGSGANTLTLSVREVVNLSPTSNTLTVIGDAGDTVNLGPGWIREPDMTIGVDPFHVFTSVNNAATLRISAAVTHPLPSGYTLPFFNGAPGVTIKGAAANDQARTVASAGDVNGDGFDDFLVGGKSASAHGNSTGAAFVVFGSGAGLASPVELSSLNGTNGFALIGASDLDNAGYSLSSADFNGDGFSDVIVGAFSADGVAAGSGAAYVVFGKAIGFAPSLELASLNGTDGFKLRGQSLNDRAGIQVDSAGDVNGDGFDDIVIGASNVPSGALVQTGRAYVVFGRATSPGATIDLAALNGATGFTIVGTKNGASLGRWISGGDVNADGFSDVIVNSGAGAAIVFGHAGSFLPSILDSTLNGVPGFTITGAPVTSVGAAGDVNGDGLGDLIVGAPNAASNGPTSGSAFVVFGKAGTTFGAKVDLTKLNGANGFQIIGREPRAYAGTAVSAAGDVNGDGFDDVILGAPFTDQRGFQNGEAYVIYGKAAFAPSLAISALDGTTGFLLVGTDFGTRAAQSVNNAGDVNGDGFDDVLVGSYGQFTFTPGGVTSPGRDYLVYGFDNGRVTQLGGSGDQTLSATGGADVIVAGQGNDTVLEVGFGDIVRGGQGDDVLSISNGPVTRLTGGNGFDTLTLAPGGGFALSLDLTKRTNSYRITGFEQVDLGPGTNFLTLDALAVLNASPTSNTLIVRADPGDFVNIGAGWISQGNEVIGGDSFLVFKQGAATLKLQEGSLAITLVNATTATFTDVDGDLATVKLNKGTLSFADFKLAPAGTVGGFQLQSINFADDGTEFKDANLTITAAPTTLGGDGRVNVGRIDATNVDLGKVSVEGDLGSIAAGDANVTIGVADLSVLSMGRFGLSTQGAGGIGSSSVIGKLGTLNIASDFITNFVVNAGTADAIGAAKIGGSILATASASGLVAFGNIGSVVVGQDIRGGAAAQSGIVSATGNIGGVTIGGSLVGGAGFGGGSVTMNGTLGAVTIGGDLDGGRIWSFGGIKSLAVTGSVLNAEVLSGYGTARNPANADATIGAVTVNGDWVASSLVAGATSTDAFFGNGGEALIAGGDPAKIAKITSITIKGEAIGVPGGADHFGFLAEEIGSFTVGGTIFPLVAGKSNDLIGLYVGSTLDAKVREVNGAVSAIDPPLDGGSGGTGGTGFGFPLSSLDGMNGFEFAGTTPVSDTGRTVDAAGDVNNDGFMDFIVGSRGANGGAGANSGEAYVVFGQASGFPASFDASALNGTNGFRIQGHVASEQLGVGAGGVGDFNNDGFDDVIVGAINLLPGVNAGSDTSAYVIFGEASFVATPTINVGALNGSNGVELRAPHDTDNGVGFYMDVSSAGDINNDGFEDAIVGVTNADNTGQSSGAVYVVFGRANSAATLIDMGALNGTGGFRFDSGASGVNIGLAVSGAGDINGDGIDDIVLGAHRENFVAGAGAAYVIFGRTTAFPATLGRSDLNGTTGFRIFGAINNGALGYSVDAAGDVNGDGFDDLVVGAPYASINGTSSGATYVIYGRKTSVSGLFPADLGVATLNGTNGFRIVGESDHDYAGRVGGVGDVNGDGFDDIGIGGFGAGTPNKNIGNGYVVFGRPTSPASIDLGMLTVRSGIKFIGVDDFDQTGASIAGVGDLNNDGLDDLLIGAPLANRPPGSPNAGPGVAYLVFGAAGKTHAPIVSPLGLGTLNGTTGFVIPGEANLDSAGRSVHAAGDVNGDGIEDLLIGSPTATVGAASDAGAAYVVFGTTTAFPASFDVSSLNGTNGFKIEGVSVSDQVGRLLGSADVNGDGFSDVIVGINHGAYVVFGKASGFGATLSVSALTGANGFKINSASTLAFDSLSGAGDVNGDGFDDVILGENRDALKGAAFVVFGQGSTFAATLDVTTLNGTNGFKLAGGADRDRAGTSVSDAGDVNGDGIGDMIVGAYGYNNYAGAAYIVYGKTSAFSATMSLAALNGADGFVLRGVTTLNQSGYSVSGAGDVNGDGFDDVIVGQREQAAGSNHVGHAYVVFGHATDAAAAFNLSALNGTNGFRMDGTGTYAYAGDRVSDAGDVNGDGFADVIVGAFGYNSDTGAAYIVYGKASGFGPTVSLSALSGTSGARLLGVGAGNQAGRAVSSAGDINGDGFADVIVGAFRAKPDGTTFTGAGYVVFGGGIGASGSGAGVGGVGGGGPVTPPPGPLSFSADKMTVTFTDVDGDLVTVMNNVAMFDGSEFTRVGVAGFNGAQLQKLKLGSGFAGANITITAARGPDGGDGFVNVGYLDARTIDLGTVTIEGDLGQLDAGNGDPLKPALTSFTVQSLGRLGLSTQAAAGASLESNIAGKISALTVKSDVVGAFVNVAGSADVGDDDTGTITISGSLRGGMDANSGAIFAAGDLGAVNIGQSVLGGAGAHSGSIEAGAKIASVAIGQGLRGGSGLVSGSLVAGTVLGAVTIGGDVSGAKILARGNLSPTSTALALALKSITIDGSIANARFLAGADRSGTVTNPDVQIGAVLAKGDWIASDLVAGIRPTDLFFGNGNDQLVPNGNSIISQIASITINGQALGTPGGADHFGFVAEQIGSFKIGTTTFPLTTGNSNDLAGLPVGATGDLRVRELS